MRFQSDVSNERIEIPTETDRGARKRADPEKWLKNVKSKIRNSKEVRPAPPGIACHHEDLDHCSANKLTPDDIQGKQIS